jgi:hypothetical protein
MALNGTMVKIETVTVGSGGAASIDFTSIPQTYTDLKIVISGRSSSTPAEGMYIAFNGSTSNFSGRYLIGDGANASSGVLARYVGSIFGAVGTANVFNNTEVYIPNYTSSNNKSFSVDNVAENNATTGYQNLIAGLWSSSSAITSISITCTGFTQHSTATLYGISRTTAQIKATGGMVYDDASFVYHLFTSSGTFTPSQALTADVVVVAGGGGGGSTVGGGGGAGGFRNISAQSLTATTAYTVTVGGGGAGGTSSNRGANGNNSSFAGTGLTTITATAGGAGGGNNQNTGNNGGSGGGSASFNGTGAGTGNSGSFSPAEGTNGGTDTGGGTFTKGGGGGGGATVAGANAGSGVGGAGGDGSSAISSWLVATNTGVDVSGTRWIAGGGGGGAGVSPTGSGGAGGKGGGGSWVQAPTVPTAAIVNTGGGGAGGGQNSDTSAVSGGAGASGIVIVRYAK